MRILFMGTPAIAATVLRALAKTDNEIVGAFCQPDKPAGRKQILTEPEVKTAAKELGIPVYQPVKLRDGSAAELIRTLSPELIAVVAYGRLLPKEILDIPGYGCVNIHASLLPKYRGAAPIQRAIANGETETGVTSMYMTEGLDTGDIIDSVSVAISPDDDAGTMFLKLADEGARLLTATVEKIAASRATRRKQDDSLATLAPPIEKSEGLFSFSEDAASIVNKARGFCIWPNAYFACGDKTVKVLKARLSEGRGAAGEVLSVKPLAVAAENGAVELVEVKPDGGRLMTGTEWAAGRRLKPKDILL